MKRSTTVRLRSYRQFAGADFVSDPSSVSLSRFHRIRNMWRDYAAGNGGAVETSPGFRRLCRFSGAVHGLFRQRAGGREYVVVHAGTGLYRVPLDDRDRPLSLAALSSCGTLADRDSSGVSLGDEVYLTDGSGWFRLSSAGTLSAVNAQNATAYAPVTHRNGELAEQRNLLSDRVRHVFTLDDLPLREEHTEGLFFTVTDEDGAEMSVAGTPAHAEASVIVLPSRVERNGKVYTVTSVAASGFAGFVSLVSVSLPDTLKTVGSRAFLGCTSLTSVTLPDGVTEIGSNAFYGCTALTSVSVGTGLAVAGTGAFANTPALATVHYAGDATAFSAITFRGLQGLNRTGLSLVTEDVPSPVPAGSFFFPVYQPTLSVLSVRVDGETIGTTAAAHFGSTLSYQLSMENGSRIRGILLHASDRSAIAGRTLEVLMEASPSLFCPDAAPDLFCTGVIPGCTRVIAHDGRLFFSGNPELPDAVFYSCRSESGHADPTYVGVLNYWREGDGAPVSSLLSCGKTLLSFKDDTLSEGAVYYHVPAATGDPRLPEIYPATEGCAGVGCAGPSLNFYDDPVFLSRGGLFGCDKAEKNAARAVSRRSSLVDPLLSAEDLSHADTAVFDGYLALLVNGKLFLGDGRQSFRRNGHAEYEWYVWDGVGSYVGDVPCYRYAEAMPPVDSPVTLTLSPRGGEPVTATVYSAADEEGRLVYYTRETVNGEEIRYPVDSDGERTGGAFSPARRLLAAAGMLFFGTGDGSLSVFSTDKRGESLFAECAPETGETVSIGGVAVSPASPGTAFHAEGELTACTVTKNGESRAGLLFRDRGRDVLCRLHVEGEEGRIPRLYYTHQDHAYPSGFSLAADDCGLPGIAKDTEPRSLCLRVKRFPGSRFTVLCRTDRHPWRESEVRPSGGDVGDADFAAFDFRTDGALQMLCREKERGWAEKQLQVYTERFRSPFGIYEISFRYRAGGRICSAGKEWI